MREQEVLDWLGKNVQGVGDDCAIIAFGETQLVFTIDMLWEGSDFPEGITPYTIGWRTVAVTLSDIAAMGAVPLAVVVALGAPKFDAVFIEESLQGGLDCCELVGARYAGGDLSKHSSLTLTSSAIGQATSPVMRSGASKGELVCVTGELGRTAAALELFKLSEPEKANKLFQFKPRTHEALKLASHATSMMDVSDGLARSLYQLAKASNIGFEIVENAVPFCSELKSLSANSEELQEKGIFTGEDFELLFTIPEENLDQIPADVNISVIGKVLDPADGIVLKGKDGVVKLEDRGYEH